MISKRSVKLSLRNTKIHLDNIIPLIVTAQPTGHKVRTLYGHLDESAAATLRCHFHIYIYRDAFCVG